MHSAMCLQITPSQICQVVANITGDESFMKKSGIKAMIYTHVLLCMSISYDIIYQIVRIIYNTVAKKYINHPYNTMFLTPTYNINVYT